MKHRGRKGLCAALVLVVATLIVGWPVLGQVTSPLGVRAAIQARYPDVPWVSTTDLAQWLERPVPQRPVLLDARQPAEHAVSTIRGARQVDPDAPDIASLGIPRDATVVVFCSVGYRSAQVAQQLHSAGYSRVYNLAGGIFQWANEGRPVYQGNRLVIRVHPYDEVWGRMLVERLRSAL